MAVLQHPSHTRFRGKYASSRSLMIYNCCAIDDIQLSADDIQHSVLMNIAGAVTAPTVMLFRIAAYILSFHIFCIEKIGITMYNFCMSFEQKGAYVYRFCLHFGK